jgi:hypothetical protein
MNNESGACSKNDNSCATKTCNWTLCIVSVIVAFVVLWLFEWVFHGMLLMPIYAETASLWRPYEQMGDYFYITLIRVLVMAMIFTKFYKYACQSCSSCYCAGIAVGLKLGVLIGIIHFGSYAYMPIPLTLAVYWLVGGIVQGVLTGLALAFTCKLFNRKKA